MIQKFLKLTRLRALALTAVMCVLGAGQAWADDVVCYTLDGTITGGSNGYATESEITQGSILWMVTGNTTMSPWRIGGKNLSEVDRPLYSTSAISDNITKVIVTNGTKTLTVNSMTLYVSSNADFSNAETVTGSFVASSTTTFARPVNSDWTNKYFKLVYNVTTSGNSNQYAQLTKMEFYTAVDNGKQDVTLSFPQSSYTANLGESFTAPTLSKSADVAVSYSSSKETVATVDATTGAVSIVGAGVTTITASFAGDNTYNSASAQYSLTVVDPNANDGSQEHPYTVAEARAAIDAGTGLTGVYATGIVSAIPTAWSDGYSNITFNIVDNDGDTDFLQAFRCVSGTGVDASTVAVGDIVVVKGNLTKYGSTYEFAQGCELVSLTHPTVTVEAPTFSPAAGTFTEAQNVTISCATDGVTIYYTTDGTEPTTSSAQYSSAIAVSTTTTIKAIAVKGSDQSTVATATYHFCSANSPYTVTEALAFSEYPANDIYVSGIVSKAPTQAPTSNGELTYYISVDGSTTNQLQVYKGKGLNETVFTAQEDIQVGDEVTIFGNVKIYNSTKEFDTGNYLVAFNRPATPIGTIALNWTNPEGVTVHVLNAEDTSIEYTSGDKVAKQTTIKIELDMPSYYQVESILVQDGTQTFDMANYSNWVFTVLYDGDITITVTVTDTRSFAELSYASDGSQWDSQTGTVTISSADEFVQPVLFINNGANISDEITYSSSNTAVATVNTEGTITIVGPGTAVITATFAGNNEYKPSTASFTIVYNNGTSADLFVRVTSTTGLTDGDYLIVYEEGTLAFDGGLETLDAVSNTISVIIENDAIAKTDDNYAARFTIAAVDGGYSIQAASGKYIGNASDTNALTASDDVITNTISFGDNNEANIVSVGGAYLRYNATSGQERFRYYKSSSYTNQQPIYLYKLGGEPDERQTVTLTFENIPSEININETATYTVTSSVEGLTITYASNKEDVVMVDENTGEIAALAVGEATITATFAGNDDYQPATASYTIQVVDPNIQTSYVALVAKYDGKYFAMNANGGATWGATEVDAVNGKVITERTDAISWLITPATANSTAKVIIKNISSKKFLNYSNSVSLSEGTTSSNWDIDSEHDSWTNNTNRSMVYRASANGFKNYAVSNIGTSDYASDYTHAYPFTPGYTRTVTVGNWGTFCIDHTIAANDYSGVTFYSIAGKVLNSAEEPMSLVLSEETGELMAGVAYIFQANEGAEKLIAAFSEESIDEPFVAADNNGLQGSFDGENVEEGMYILKNNTVVKCGTGNRIGANRAFIDMESVPIYYGLTNAAGVKTLGFSGSDVDGIQALDGEIRTGVIYNLAGQRLQRPMRGVNIVNGKKMLIK